MSELKQNKELIVAEVARLRPLLVELNRRIYDHPEIGLQEWQTAALLGQTLKDAGFTVEEGVAGLSTAFAARLGNGDYHIALLAEMDALPTLGHACGHNIIGVAAVGAAIALARTLPKDSFRLTLLGTPAEELGIGKVELIRAGAFRDVDVAMMVHPSSRRLVIKEYLGLVRLSFTFYGRAAHAAAYPEEGINALDAVIQTFNAINALRQQTRQDVRLHGIITDGGVAPNIIPERAACSFYVRAADLDELQRVKARVIACAEGAALVTGCRLHCDEDPRILAPLKINRSLSNLYSRQLSYLGLEEAVAPPDRNRGSSDIGNVSQVVPTIHPHVPIGSGIHIHTDPFAQATVSPQGEEALVEGATALALTACELILSPAERRDVAAEFGAP
ncbi:MAG TPA: M20 family metallopeptidase [Geobacterales bacterium]|nr:M20 family metallopeptidase [Geobacterales bacterium]